ncbi:uncharacterized protein LODBEIA_P59850 [Lodderomyces beijingensis]|uniref:SH3 domain-containing protein n=1 Tax=Lodderomyces beijingensis TaxID=1775926 RepID=A0ABP0ZW86_9ASCO
MRTGFPSNTEIKDFGYPQSHPLHLATSLRSSYQSCSEECNTSDDTSTTSSSTSSKSRRRQKAGTFYGGGEQHQEDDDEEEEEEEDYDEDCLVNDEINCKARAIFDFHAENDNEIALVEGQIIWISYRHGQGWLVAEDPTTGENGLVPEEYVELFGSENNDDLPKPFLPEIFRSHIRENDDADWVDTDGSGDDYSFDESESDRNKVSDSVNQSKVGDGAVDRLAARLTTTDL